MLPHLYSGSVVFDVEVQANVDVEVQADAEPFQSEGMVSVAFYSSDPSSNWKQLDLKKFQLSNKKDDIN